MAKPIEIIDNNSPLFSEDAEKSVLAALLYSPERDVISLSSDCFYTPKWRTTFEAMKTLREDGKIPDQTALIVHFQSIPKTDGRGAALPVPSMEDIFSLKDILQGTADATLKQNIEILKEFAKRRRAKELGLRLVMASTERSMDIDATLSEIGEEKDRIEAAASLSEILNIPTLDEVRERLKKRPVGIPTPYWFGQGKPQTEQEQLIFPSGAITLICAPTSHGKSTMLRNFALQIAKSDGDGSVLYFTYEEDWNSVFEEFENTHIGEFISNRNTLQIKDLHTTGNFNNKLKSKDSTVTVDSFNKDEEDFYNIFIKSGKLRIFYNDFESGQLIRIIRMVCKNIKVKAVFIDYIQLLRQANCKLQRREELRDIGIDLKNLAVELSIPIIAAAQLNREAKSPIEMRSQNIAESADLERVANTIVCLWNSSFNASTGSNGSGWINDKAYSGDTSDKGKGVKKTQEQLHIEGDLNFHIGQGGQVYAILAKNRGGSVGLDSVFDFNGNFGKVTDTTHPEESKPKDNTITYDYDDDKPF